MTKVTLLRRHWPALLLALIALLDAVGFLNIASEIGQPFGGYFANRNQSTTTWKVDSTTPPWWPGLTPTQLRYDDTLLSIEGQPYGGAARALFAEAYAAHQPSVRLVISRAGEKLTLDQPLFTFTPSQFLDLRLPDFIVGLSFWLLALAVYSARPQAAVNRLFAVTCSLVCLALWSGVSDLFPYSGFITRGIDLVWGISTPFLGITIIHLALLFPRPIQRLARFRLALLYPLMACVAILMATSSFLRWSGTGIALADDLGNFGNRVIIGSYALSVAVYIARLTFLITHRGTSRRTRRQAGLMLWGMGLVLPYVFVILTRNFGGVESPFFWNDIDSRYLVLAVPLTFTFVILRYQTSQSTHPLLIVVFILATSAFLANLGEWIMRLVEPRGYTALQWSPFVPFFLAALLASLFWSAQASWQGLLGRFFQWERRSYTEVRQFGQHLIGQTDLVQLPAAIAAALVTHLQLECAAVWLWEETEHAFRLAGQAGDSKIVFVERLTPDVPLTPRPIHLSTESVPPPTWLAPARASGILEVIAPLTVSGQPVGLLGLGKRWDEEIFDERDLEILDLIAQQAALFILTARQIEQLRQVPHQVAIAQERERFGIAQELHDTVQQFLGRLPFYLQVSRDSARADPAEADRLLQRSIAEVESAAQAVRQIRNNLAPLQLEQSLTQPLTQLVEHFRDRTGVAVSLTLFPELDMALALDVRHALYRMIQQTLDNVAEHAQAKNVTIALDAHDSRLHFTIADDGVGFAADQRARAEAQGSFGLKSMQARITALGGEFEIQSSPGTGTQVSGWLPCKDEG